jgi:iron(III) transport system ATP-binding protein
MAEVKLTGAAKYYGKHRVFENLNLIIQDGECFTLLGPSGCGKTVLLRLVAGFETLSAGEISIGGSVVSSIGKKIHLPPESRRISVVFQDYAVWPHKTVHGNVIYPLQIQKIEKKEADQRTRKAIEQVGLSGLETRLPYQLSGGQQQRVALARALVSRPEIMLLDEPLCNLDANLREEMRFEIRELQRQTGFTILYVTHDQELAMSISDRVAIMDRNGRIRQLGTPEDIYERPADRNVFQFMGISNFVPVVTRENSVYIRGTDLPLFCPLPEGLASGKEALAGFRPSDVDLLRKPNGLPLGRVKRRILLGPMIDYRIDLAGIEIRVQQDTHDALTTNGMLDEGEACGLKFHNLKWFDDMEDAAE